MDDVDQGKNLALGYLCCFIAVLFFGSNYLPVKKFDAGDGFFFQWILCIGIWVTGWICGCIAGWPDLTPSIREADGNGSQRWQILMSLGGALWATGNVVVVPVIGAIGLGVGLCIWGTSNMICGWLSGITGAFGKSHERGNLFESGGLALNIVGAVFALAAGIFYFLIEPDVDATKDQKGEEQRETTGTSSTVDVDNEAPCEKEETIEIQTSSNTFAKRMTGVLLAIAAGCFYGFNFNPVFSVQQRFTETPLYCTNPARKGPNPENCAALMNVFAYVFWHFTGIVLCSTLIFLVYCAVKKNKPTVNPKIILPAFVSGVMWAIAQIAWFYANDQLGLSIAFPIITSGPGAVGVLWSIVHEEKEGEEPLYRVFGTSPVRAFDGRSLRLGCTGDAIRLHGNPL
eukprot:GEMP01069562.1.p1 GENE.GEMP01069562.1~~GEMP01069562.1.p1  ORF type:complete len:400 (+),score=33.99 GEMP01069562.1:34-1233(+)